MVNVSCGRIKLKPDSLERVREWAKALNECSVEALDTMRNEGSIIESVFLDQCSDGDYLIYYVRVENHEKAREVFRNSQLPIDVYHKQFKRETWAENKKLELLVDLEVK